MFPPWCTIVLPSRDSSIQPSPYASAGDIESEVTINADPADPRVDDIPGNLTPQWGLHLVDMNLVMGDLVALANSQATAWLREH